MAGDAKIYELEVVKTTWDVLINIYYFGMSKNKVYFD